MAANEGPGLFLVGGTIEDGFLRLELEEPTALPESTPRRTLKAYDVNEIAAMSTLIEPTRRFYGLQIILKNSVVMETFGVNQKMVERIVMEWATSRQLFRADVVSPDA